MMDNQWKCFSIIKSIWIKHSNICKTNWNKYTLEYILEVATPSTGPGTDLL